MSSGTLRSGIIRALRTYIVVVGPALLSLASGTGPVTIDAVKVILWSGVPAAASFLWRVLIDPLPVPTLADKPSPDAA